MVVSAVILARRNCASACENHFWILNPKIRKLDGDMSNRCGGGGLGGERGDDCGRDLCLKGRSGVCHPEINKNCGLELAQAAAAAEMGNEKPKDYLTRRRTGETVAGVILDNNTGSTTQSKL